MKIIRFETTCHNELQGSKHSDNLHKIMFVEIQAPENLEELATYEIVDYIEKLTKLFVFSFEILEKE